MAQVDSADHFGQLAAISVNVTDSKQKPRKGEQIFFEARQGGKRFSGRSDAKGKFMIQVPVGNSYIIRVKTLKDSTLYGIIEIPALPEGQEYAEPFGVNIEFEPARSYTLNNVHFDFGKASLRADSYAELNELVDYLIWREHEKIEIGGHTDNVGSDEDNLKLSQLRANTIREYLVKKGIKRERVMAMGYGAGKPLAGNDTEEGRQRNRRTEVRIL